MCDHGSTQRGSVMLLLTVGMEAQAPSQRRQQWYLHCAVEVILAEAPCGVEPLLSGCKPGD